MVNLDRSGLVSPFQVLKGSQAKDSRLELDETFSREFITCLRLSDQGSSSLKSLSCWLPRLRVARSLNFPCTCTCTAADFRKHLCKVSGV
jgi:hypothetical protein